MKFDINSYDDMTAMHCETIEQARFFTHYLASLGLTWMSGNSYERCDNWELHGQNTCYRFKVGEYARIGFYKENDYKILEFTDFEWDGFVDPEEISISSEDSEKIDNFLSDFSKN